MGEHLLCKQGVVGSIPSASRALLCGAAWVSAWTVWLGGVVVTEKMRDRVLGAGSPLLGGVWRLGLVACALACLAGGSRLGSLLIVNQVLVRFGRAGRLGGFLPDRVSGLAGADAGGP